VSGVARFAIIFRRKSAAGAAALSSTADVCAVAKATLLAATGASATA